MPASLALLEPSTLLWLETPGISIKAIHILLTFRASKNMFLSLHWEQEEKVWPSSISSPFLAWASPTPAFSRGQFPDTTWASLKDFQFEGDLFP